MIDIIEVVIEPGLHCLVIANFAAMAVHLRPAGDSRLDVVPSRIAIEPFDVALVMSERMRPWADNRHFTRENVDELRQFVDAEAAQICAQTRYARIGPRRLDDVGAVLHRSSSS